MRLAFPRKLWLVGLLALPLVAQAKPPAEQWFTVVLDGRKIGSFESTREVRGAQVVTTQTLDMVLDRAGSHVALSNAETSTETIDGKPLAFRSVSQLSGSDTIIEGRLDDRTIAITTHSVGATQHRRMPWPRGAVLPEGLRLVGIRAGLKPGTRYQALSFQPSSLDAAEVSNVVRPQENVDLPAGGMRLNPIEQTIAFPGAPMRSRAWVDAEQTIYKLAMPLMGVDLVLLACDRACATAPNQGSDIFQRTLMPSPRPLTTSELAGTMRYTLGPRANGAPLARGPSV